MAIDNQSVHLKKKMSSNRFSLQKFFSWCLLAYLAILPMSNTIAVRNLLLFVLVSILLFSVGFRCARLEVHLTAGLRQVPLALMIWVVFLCVFPLWAEQSNVAWLNLKGQWLESFCAWVVGFGAVLLLGRRGPSLWALALASAFPIAAHLLLVVMAWANLLGNDFPADMSLSAVFEALKHTLDSSSLAVWSRHLFPWGFRGLEPMHGNLGYAACQAIALFGVCFYFAWRDHFQSRIWGAALGIALCFLSILIANSRGAVLYSAVVLTLVVLISFLRFKGGGASDIDRNKKIPRLIMGITTLAVSCLSVLAALQSVKHDARWNTMIDKVKVGLLTDKPIDFLCNGISSEMEAQIRERFADRGPAYADDLIYGLKIQDGGRILLMRVGLDLMLESPRGLDGSRDSYKKLIEAKCGRPPVLKFAHSHQGWIDMALALGWAGALIFAWLMSYLLRAGWRNKQNEARRPWAFALVLISAFWILRGLSDSVYREHYLQMQALLLAYLFWRIKFAPEISKDNARH